MVDDEVNGYFNQICKDAMKELNTASPKCEKLNTYYVFKQEHVDYIKSQKGFEDVKCIKEDGYFILQKLAPKKESKSRNQIGMMA